MVKYYIIFLEQVKFGVNLSIIYLELVVFQYLIQVFDVAVSNYIYFSTCLKIDFILNINA